jgi:hypothetical protein
MKLDLISACIKFPKSHRIYIPIVYGRIDLKLIAVLVRNGIPGIVDIDEMANSLPIQMSITKQPLVLSASGVI